MKTKIFYILGVQLLFTFQLLIAQSTPKYTWKGKEVLYKQWRDSLKYEYLKFCDSLQKNDRMNRIRKKY